MTRARDTLILTGTLGKSRLEKTLARTGGFKYPVLLAARNYLIGWALWAANSAAMQPDQTGGSNRWWHWKFTRTDGFLHRRPPSAATPEPMRRLKPWTMMAGRHCARVSGGNIRTRRQPRNRPRLLSPRCAGVPRMETMPKRGPCSSSRVKARRSKARAGLRRTGANFRRRNWAPRIMSSCSASPWSVHGQ